MAIRYNENTKPRAVGLVREHRDDYDSEWAAMKAVSGRLGMTAETLRKWVRQAEEDVSSSVELRWRPGEHQAALTSSLSAAVFDPAENVRAASCCGLGGR